MSITIRKTCLEDAGAMARIMGDPAVFPGLMQMPHASEEAWAARLGETLAPGKPDLLLVAEQGGQIVGSSGLHPGGAALRRRHAMVLGISVAPAAQRGGVGTALMHAMCDYADNWMAALRLELTVYVDNEPAIALYRKFGFMTEGRFRGYAMRDGEYVDAYAMARIHPAPPRIDPLPEARP